MGKFIFSYNIKNAKQYLHTNSHAHIGEDLKRARECADTIAFAIQKYVSGCKQMSAHNKEKKLNENV